MVHAHDPAARAEGEALGEGRPHEQAAEQAGPSGDGNAADGCRGQVLAAHELVEERAHVAQVLAAGEFGNHAAEKGVDVRLARQHGVHEHAVPHQRQGGFVARAFYAEH